MTGAADFLAYWSAPAAAWQLAALAAKATLLLALGLAVAPLAGRRSAAARHLIWAATLAGVLALPALRAAGPRWTPRTAHELAVVVERLVPSNWPAGPGPNAGLVVPRSEVRARAGRAVVRDAIAAGLLLVWSAGVLARVAALARGAAARRRLARRSRAAEHTALGGGAAVADVVDRLAVHVGVRRPVRVVWGPTGAMPMTWGVRRPVVLLPADVEAWPAPERDAVLRHELAHVRRGDAGWALVAELACAVFWFHPGVWLARSARTRWQERAADALAVAAGAERHAYAAALVGAARSLVRAGGARPVPMAAPAFAFHVGLAERLRVLTAPGFAPDPCTRRRRPAILAGAALSAVALAALDRARAMPPAAAAAWAAALAAQTDPAAFIAADSTLVVLVPATADAAALRATARRLAREDVQAVYTTDDRAARRTADALHWRVGGSLINYDRVGMSDSAFAAVLVESAVGANPRRTVAVVIEPALVRPFVRRAAAAAGVDVGPAGDPGGRANGALVLTVAPRTDALVRARY